MKPLISIVIPTKDNEKSLGQCLDSIRSQSFNDFEIIVVDGLSQDSTLSIAEDSADKVLSYDGPVPAARNRGFSVAQGRIFLSVDSDMVLEPGLLEDIIRSMDGHGALVIPEHGCGSGFLSGCKSLEKECYLGDGSIEAARAFSKESFKAVNGYDEGLHFGEDRDIHIRISRRFTLGRTRDGLLHDTGDLSFFLNMRKAFTYGKTLSAFSKKHSSATSRWLSPRRLLRYLPILARKPAHAIGLFLIKGSESAAALLGLTMARLNRPVHENGSNDREEQD
jgi:glycosyltransferase involved in cell wall biosynthesis